jgi:hypothetical protein
MAAYIDKGLDSGHRCRQLFTPSITSHDIACLITSTDMDPLVMPVEKLDFSSREEVSLYCSACTVTCKPRY